MFLLISLSLKLWSLLSATAELNDTEDYAK